ncbi:hypothetical protein AB0M28_01200 [Streptomyces sp. NPDC051940]|uniref:hypothetical protein n=1 Tax=Streptomyces sp. NPDC051940 TaxID=3155675 RepID=UPI003414D6AC
MALTLASFLVVGSLLMLAATKPHTPERTITVIALVGGIAAMAVTAALIRFSHRRGRTPMEGK